MCIQSVGEKKCTQCNLSGPAIIINDGNFWRNHAKLQQVFYFWVGTVSSHPPKQSIRRRPSFRFQKRPPKVSALFTQALRLLHPCSCRQWPNVDHAKVYHLVEVSAFFASRLLLLLRGARELQYNFVQQLFGGLDLMSSLFVSVLLLPGKS